MGRNLEGQLGIGEPNILQKSAPVLIENLGVGKPIKIATGAYHSMWVMSNGELYSWGRAMNGWLGHGNTKNLFEPMKVEFNEPIYPFIESMSGGRSHSIVVRNTLSLSTLSLFYLKLSIIIVIWTILLY